MLGESEMLGLQAQGALLGADDVAAPAFGSAEG